MTTDETKKEPQNGYNGPAESKKPDAGYNNQKGGDPYGSKYQCPKKCEAGTTYDQPLNCPVCNEKLILVVS